jgi:hypothetical protein
MLQSLHDMVATTSITVSMGSSVSFGDVLLGAAEYMGIDSTEGSPEEGGDGWWDLRSNQLGRQFSEWVHDTRPKSEQVSTWIRKNVLSP